MIGENCHIIAQSENGARGQEQADRENIHREENIILLCRNHHKLVDDCPEKYTSDILRRYKRQHEEWVRERLNRGKSWDVNFLQVYYMNLTRIGGLAAQQGIYFDPDMRQHACLHDLGFELNYLMEKVQHLLEGIQICAVELEEGGESLMIGQFVSINGNFYTKNVPMVSDVRTNKYCTEGDFTKDAHLHREYNGKKCILTLEPRWLATSTAYANFRSGHVSVAGFGMITDITDNRMVITPYVLGVPRQPYDILREASQCPLVRSFTVEE